MDGVQLGYTGNEAGHGPEGQGCTGVLVVMEDETLVVLLLLAKLKLILF